VAWAVSWLPALSHVYCSSKYIYSVSLPIIHELCVQCQEVPIVLTSGIISAGQLLCRGTKLVNINIKSQECQSGMASDSQNNFTM